MSGREPTPGPESTPRRRYHFHTPGVLYIVVTLFLAIGALNSQNNLLFASLGLAIGGLLVSGILSGGSLMGVRVERAVGPSGAGGPGGVRGVHVGEPFAVTYRVRNRNLLLPAFGLTVTELTSGGSARANWSEHLGAPRAFVPHVPPRGESEAVALVEARRRGRVTFGSSRTWTTFPFGLAKKSVTVNQPASAVIHPVSLPVRRGVLERLAVRSMSGEGTAVEPGSGEELYGLREYSDGDNPRWIAWRRSARTGQLLVRQNTTPSPRKLWIVVRIDRGAAPIDSERAIALASALVNACASEGAAVGLAISSHEVIMPPRASVRAVRGMLERLAELNVGAPHALGDFPAGAVRAGANVVIHAGGVDRAYGTVRTMHVGVEEMDRLLSPGADLERAKELLERSVAPRADRRPAKLWARVASLLGVGPAVGGGT